MSPTNNGSANLIKNIMFNPKSSRIFLKTCNTFYLHVSKVYHKLLTMKTTGRFVTQANEVNDSNLNVVETKKFMRKMKTCFCRVLISR